MLKVFSLETHRIGRMYFIANSIERIQYALVHTESCSTQIDKICV